MSGPQPRKAPTDHISDRPIANAEPPNGFVPYRRSSPYLDLIGPVYEAEGQPLVVGLWLGHKHTNSRGFVHAGLLGRV